MSSSAAGPGSPAHRVARLWILLYVIAWGSLMFVVSPFDLPLSMAVHTKDSWFGNVIFEYGTYPSYLIYVLSAVSLVVGFFTSVSPLMKKAASTMLISAIVQPLAITQILKFIWGRIRFFDLNNDFSLFTPFYLPNDPGAGQSFPSGHVASAFVFASLAALMWQQGKKRAGFAIGFATLAWGVTVAAFRIINGAHYLTDTLFSAGLALLLAPFLARAGASLIERFGTESRVGQTKSGA